MTKRDEIIELGKKLKAEYGNCVLVVAGDVVSFFCTEEIKEELYKGKLQTYER